MSVPTTGEVTKDKKNLDSPGWSASSGISKAIVAKSRGILFSKVPKDAKENINEFAMH